MPKNGKGKKNTVARSMSAVSAAAAASAAMAGPPQIVQTPRTMDVLRFQVLTAITSSVDITWGCLRNLYYQTITTVTGNTIMQAIRLSKIEVWAPPNGSSSSLTFASAATLRFREGDGMIGEDKIVSEVVTSSAGARIHRKFSKTKTDTGKWHLCSEITAGDIAFSIIALPAGAVIDIHLAWSGWATGSGVVALTVGGVTAGRMVRNYLDNTTAAGVVGPLNIAPIGVVGTVGTAFG